VNTNYFASRFESRSCVYLRTDYCICTLSFFNLAHKTNPFLNDIVDENKGHEKEEHSTPTK